MNPLVWTAQEYFHTEKSNDWFWAIGLGSVLCAIAAWWSGNALLSILLLLAGFVLILTGSRPPRIIEVRLTRAGVQMMKELYPFESVSSFWIDEEHPFPTIVFTLEKSMLPHLRVPVGDMPTETIRAFLSPLLPEIPHVHSFGDLVGELIGL